MWKRGVLSGAAQIEKNYVRFHSPTSRLPAAQLALGLYRTEQCVRRLAQLKGRAEGP